MRRSQLVKVHTKEFCDWLDNIYMKDKARLNERDGSDEILAADYDAVIRQFNEDRKHKNVVCFPFFNLSFFAGTIFMFRL